MRLAPLCSTCVYLNINGRYDRPKISHELQVSVPRTGGILRDVPEKIHKKSLNSRPGTPASLLWIHKPKINMAENIP